MFVFSIIILTGLISYFLWKRRDLYWLSWHLPGPFALPFGIGNAPSMHPTSKCAKSVVFLIWVYKNVKFFRLDLHSYLDRWSQTYPSPFRIWLGPIMCIFIADAENVEILMKSKDCLNKPHTFYKMIRDGLGVDGLFTLDGK